MNAALATQINQLSPAEKLKLVEEVWDALTSNPEQLGVPESHAKLLAEDQAAYDANPHQGSSWTEVKARITRQS